MAIVCHKCGKIIKGKSITATPPMFMVRLIGETEKQYHPKCYEWDEAKVTTELKGR